MNFNRYFSISCLVFFLIIISGCGPVRITETLPLVPEPVTLTPFNTSTIIVPISTTGDPDQQLISTPTPTPVVYSVKKDELGSSIALRYGISLANLQASNPGVDLNFLKEGQELIIPPMEKTPVPDLSSPTTAAILVTGETCYPADDGAAWCIASITNNQSESVMYITGEFILLANDLTRQAPFTADIDILPPGRSIPVYAYLKSPFAYPYQLNVSIQSALLQSNEFEPIDYEIVDKNIMFDPSGLVVQITGKISVATPAPDGITVIAAGYGGERPAGVRKLELDSSTAAGSEIEFQIWLYSVGPAIDRVELFVQDN